MSSGEIAVADRNYYSSSFSPQNSKKEETTEHNICYICGCNGGNWSLYTKENDKDKAPYFPFLELIEKAEGAKVLKENGRIDACTVCFSFLTQQWHSYEEIGTPIDKRSYWLKTTATGANIDFYRDQNFGRETTVPSCGDNNCFEKKENVVETRKNIETVEKDEQVLSVSDNDRGTLSNYNKIVVQKDSTMSVENFPINNVSEGSNDESEIYKFCFVCGTHQAKDIMKTVHTKPQLRKETPFYPVLAHHKSKTVETSKVGFTGKVLVCKDCDMVLLNQWERFQHKGTPLSDRQYQLPSNKSISCNESKQSLFSTCFICEGKYLEKRFIMYAKQRKPGDPYFPFLFQLSPITGTKSSLGEHGLVQTCRECHNSLIDQWKSFEQQGIDEHEREYHYKSKHSRNFMDINRRYEETCCICKQSYPVVKMEYIERSLDKKCVPVIPEYKDQQLVCYHCKSSVNRKNDESDLQDIDKEYAVLRNREENSTNSQSQTNQSQTNQSPFVSYVNSSKTGEVDICFLCGDKIRATESKKLFVFPQQSANGYKPFFPSLAYRVPAFQAKPPTTSGTVIVCCYCHGNMINQWYKFQEMSGMANPWARNYMLSQFTCYLCGNIYPRQKITSISVRNYPFLNKIRRPSGAFRLNQQDCVVCNNCKEIVHVQKENFGKCKVDIHEREYELPMVTSDSNTNWTSKTPAGKSGNNFLSNSQTVVVIGDSESEGEELSTKIEQNQLSDNSLKLLTGNKQAGTHVQEKGLTVQNLPMSSPASAQNSSFAAALRKLAKQAMSPGSTATIPSSTNQTLSPVKQKGGDSPKLNGNNGGFKKEVPDAGFLNSKENRGHPNVPLAAEMIATSMGHQVLPGVYSLGPRGLDSKSNPLEEHHGPARLQDLPRLRAVHPQPPFYMPFLQRPPMSDSAVYMPPPIHYYPPPMVDSGLIPPGFDHETWRKRRAMEHLRQQHERHTHFFPPHERPFYIMEQDHVKAMPAQSGLPGQRPYLPDLQQGRESNFGKNSSRPDSNTISESGATNTSSPKETENNVEAVSSRLPSSRTEHSPIISSCSTSSRSSTGITQNSQVLGGVSRDTEKEGEVEPGREHQIMWTRKIFEQKRRIRQEEIEWQHRQQQMRQQKREVQQELYQFRQKLLQQKESELEDSSKREHEKLPEKENDSKSPLIEEKKEKSEMAKMSMEKMVFPTQYGYSICHDQAGSVHTGQAMHMSTMYRQPSGLPPHEIFCPPSYLSQQPISSRMDTRMYREYLQRPSHFLDSKVVSEWLQKQKHSDGEITQEKKLTESHKPSLHQFGSLGLVNGTANKDIEKNCHEPLKLKFMKDLGLMTVSEKKEQSQSILGNGKRKLVDNAQEDESNKENRFENGENVSEYTKSVKEISTEQDNDGEAYCKKVDFLYNLGLVTHGKRQELENNFEKNRWERRAQRFQRKAKRAKKQKKDKERSRSRTPLDVSGPITRQKQQLLQEYGLLLPIKDSQEKDSSSDCTTVDSKEKDNEETKSNRKETGGTLLKDDNEKIFHSAYEVSTPPPPPRQNTKLLNSGPQLTLQSITHMENPYGIPSAFRPPYYRAGLSSDQPNISKDNHPIFTTSHNSTGCNNLTGKSNFLRSQSVFSNAALQDCPGTSLCNGKKAESHWSASNQDIPKWPGPNNVIQSYVDYHQDQENEFSILKEKSEKLKVENGFLNQECERANLKYTGLALSKRKLEDDQRILNGKLDRMHNFLFFVQNR